MHLTGPQLDALRGKFADIPVAVYVPACNGGFVRPDLVGSPFTVTEAEHLAQEIREASGNPDAAFVLAYGIPWTP